MFNLSDPRWQHILPRFGFLILVLFLFFLWYRSRKASVLLIQIFVFLSFWLFLEFISWISLRFFWTHIEKPSHVLFRYSQPVGHDHPPMYGHYDPDFDLWRLPNDTASITRCDNQSTLVYRSNSLGLRDYEHAAHSTTPRFMWIGDSFTEGVMVNVEDRASSWVEKWTQIPQINLGIRSSSTINHCLIYQKFKSKYDHDALVVGVLPANDFEDYQPHKKLSILEYPIYRPYYDSSGQIHYSLRHVHQAFGSIVRYNRPDLVYQTRDSLYRTLTWKEKVQVEWNSNSYVWALINGLKVRQKKSNPPDFNSFDQDIPEKAWRDFERSILHIKKEAKARPILVALYPTLTDINAYLKNPSMQLADRIQAFCKEHNLRFINSLPHFATHPDPASLYVPCDGHWNEAGEQHVAKLLVQDEFFQKRELGIFEASRKESKK